MILDSEAHRTHLLRLLTMPGLSIVPQGEEKTLEEAARGYLSVLDSVRSATVGDCACAREEMPLG